MKYLMKNQWTPNLWMNVLDMAKMNRTESVSLWHWPDAVVLTQGLKLRHLKWRGNAGANRPTQN